MVIVFVAYGIFIGACALMVVWPTFALIRSERVFRYRGEMLIKIHNCCLNDLKNDLPWRWRYEMFRTVTHNDMCRRFWVKLDDFYPDKSFIKA